MCHHYRLFLPRARRRRPQSTPTRHHLPNPSTCAAATTPSAAGECLHTILDVMLQCTQSDVDGALEQLISVLVGGDGQVTCDATSVAFVLQYQMALNACTKSQTRRSSTLRVRWMGCSVGLLGYSSENRELDLSR
ncbi:hypothetical protein FIBSPDRAFT_61287 [Athelia psychrophila]|uniref:Uncharacterized protein n=1 Tax=Athelia psychrophila TaxID=1759441 RepID=A0A166F679_9AGAM|nr:hypothetical protein FIBSPDRAFT_61287 [Fibularhizoctonia sp. CBS 109695]